LNNSVSIVVQTSNNPSRCHFLGTCLSLQSDNKTRLTLSPHSCLSSADVLSGHCGPMLPKDFGPGKLVVCTKTSWQRTSGCVDETLGGFRCFCKLEKTTVSSISVSSCTACFKALKCNLTYLKASM
jgi:hypothetical protein